MRRMQIALIVSLYALALGSLVWQNINLERRDARRVERIAAIESELAGRDVELRNALGALHLADRTAQAWSNVETDAEATLAAFRAHALEIHGCTLKSTRTEALGRAGEGFQVSGDPLK